MHLPRPGEENGFLRGSSTKELGDAAAHRLSRVQSSSGSLRAGAPGGASLEDTVKQQASTIHAQALKLQQLQSLLDFALKQKSEEDVEDEKRVRQLEEIIAFKDMVSLTRFHMMSLARSLSGSCRRAPNLSLSLSFPLSLYM